MFKSERKQPGGKNLGYKLALLFDTIVKTFLEIKQKQKMAQSCT